DVLNTLQELATYHRNYCKAKIIALTGSNGKTTTKALINQVLSQKYKTIATQGNLNNHIGVPLSLLQLQEDTEIGIIEMGANHQKEIEFLSAIAQPDFGYITNFGKAHLEGFGGVQGVIKGKSELYTHIFETGGLIFYNADDPIQLEKLSQYPSKFGYSTTDKADLQIKLTEANPFVSLKTDGVTINTHLIGSYNFPNCCASILMGHYFKVPTLAIKKGIEDFIPADNRSQLVEKNGHKIILDAYNANPSSMEVTLQYFKNLKAEHKTIFLGDMFELGVDAEIEHQKIASLAKSMKFDKVFLVGEHFNKTAIDLPKYSSFDELANHLKSNQLAASTLLIKGSRGMALERILDYL
ncbi:MAG: UDP-N-acetylmuramoyl-tripeptide--D-alanyl-D-alanine ligase, partial [Eudoraea sp.]